ncbi:MAG: flagellar basal body rod C-terminal domain-containing protein [Pseudomonadota bacterium]
MSSLALAGLQAASTRAAVRAQNISNMLTPGYQSAEPVQTSTPAGPTVTVNAPPPVAPAPQSLFADVDLPREFVDLQMAKRAFEASAAVFKTADEMSKEAIDLLG